MNKNKKLKRSIYTSLYADNSVNTELILIGRPCNLIFGILMT
jgi:hypothetical protein